MPTVKAVEARILKVEGFQVRMLHPTGRDVRSDLSGLPAYPYQRQMKNSGNVKAWRDSRFYPIYGGFGFGVEVLNWNNHKAKGNTLARYRADSYLEG